MNARAPTPSRTFKFSNNDDKTLQDVFASDGRTQRIAGGRVSEEISEAISEFGELAVSRCAVTLREEKKRKKSFPRFFSPACSPNSCASIARRLNVFIETRSARFYPWQSVWQRGEHFQKRSCITKHYEAFYSTGSSDFERFFFFFSIEMKKNFSLSLSLFMTRNHPCYQTLCISNDLFPLVHIVPA